MSAAINTSVNLHLLPDPEPPPAMLPTTPSSGVRLPEIVNFLDLPTTVGFRTPVVLVDGLIHIGTKTAVGGPPKAKKTWFFHDLSVSVASGGTFLGRQCAQGRVLLVDLELPTYFVDRRVRQVAQAKGVGDHVFQNLDVLSLRGHACDLQTLKRLVLGTGTPYSLIVIDPLYRLIAGQDDNQSKDVSLICQHIECLAEEIGAATLIGMHFSKGNPAYKSSMDRIAGSGVYARDADTIITLTPHREDNCFVAEFTLRNFPPVPPLVLRWDLPLYVPEPDLAPILQETSRRRPDFPETLVGERIIEIVSEAGSIAKTALIKRVQDLGYPRDPVRELVENMLDGEALEPSGERPIMIALGREEEAAA